MKVEHTKRSVAVVTRPVRWTVKVQWWPALALLVQWLASVVCWLMGWYPAGVVLLSTVLLLVALAVPLAIYLVADSQRLCDRLEESRQQRDD